MRTIFDPTSKTPVFVGVVHLLPTPGSPGFGGDPDRIQARAVEDAEALVEGGVDAVMVENFGDTPFFGERVPPETVAAMALAIRSVRAALESAGRSRPLGVNVLRNDARAALALCAVTRASFLRVNVHTGAMVTDQGLLEGRAAETLRERERLAPGAHLLADVHVKHATPLGGESLEGAALDAWERGRADGLVLSGTRTGSAPDVEEVVRVRERLPRAPLWIGSGLDPENAPALLPHVAGALVSTWLSGGDPLAPVRTERVARLREAFDRFGGNP